MSSLRNAFRISATSKYNTKKVTPVLTLFPKTKELSSAKLSIKTNHELPLKKKAFRLKDKFESLYNPINTDDSFNNQVI